MLKQVLFCGLPMLAGTAVAESTDQAALSADLISSVNRNTGDYIGDFNIEKITPLVEALAANPDSEDAYNALLSASTSSEYMNMPIAGHYYRITSAFPYFKGDYLKETYYTYDYDYANSDGSQRVYFHKEEAEENEVPSFWLFESKGKGGGYYDDYYIIRSANTGLGMRIANNSRQVDMRSVSRWDIGLYSIGKIDSHVVYDHAVALRSHYNNTDRTYTGYMGTYTVNQGEPENRLTHDGEDTDIRTGNTVLQPTDDFVQGANNWIISEVKEVPIYFYGYDESLGSRSSSSNSGNGDVDAFYTTICYPFAIKVPEGVTAYSAGVGLVNGGNTLWLTEIEVTPDMRRDIVPANTPAILKTDEEGCYYATILYDDNHATVNFGLEGTLAPLALSTKQQVYIIADDYDDVATLVTEGLDYSYDDSVEYKDSGKAPKSLYKSDSTYILEANTAYALAKTTNAATLNIADLNRPTTGVEGIAIDRQDGSDAPVYYNLHGQRVNNPSAGIYILSTGKKVIIR